MCIFFTALYMPIKTETFGRRTKLIIPFPIVQFFLYLYASCYILVFAISHGIKMVFRQTDLKRRALNVRKKYVGSDVTRLCSFLFYFKHKLTQPRF